MTSAIREMFLGNGMKVILKGVHSAPVTSTWLWYRVGSRNEVEGCTGMSHWVEHMMFKGSSQFAKGEIMRAVDRYGGYANAMTSYDFTAYYATLPGDRAELALRIEADRLATATFDPIELEAERSVIVAEREGSENEPRYMLAEKATATAFRVHPYHHQTIGWKEDLANLTRDQIYAHYKRYYVPNNAVLVIVGDFQVHDHLALVERLFGHIPPEHLPNEATSSEPIQCGERRVTLRMPGSAPIVRISYHTPPVSHRDYVPLVILDAILSGGKAMFAFGGSQARSARLYRALVETRLASSVGSSYHPSLDPFLLTVGATVRDGRQPTEVERALLAEVARLQDEPVQDRELRVAVRQTQAQFAYSSESVTGQALTLGFLEIVDDYKRVESIFDELAQATPGDVQRVARAYLTEDNRTVGWFSPTTGEQGTTVGASGAAHCTIPNRGMFAYSKVRTPTISAETVTRRQLDNGIVILVKENPASACVTIAGEMEAGSFHETDATAGLAALTASMLRRGTQKHTFQELNASLDSVGASASFSAMRDAMAFGGRALAEDFTLLVDLLAEILMQPSFPGDELETIRGQILTHLGILETDTAYRADQTFVRRLYPTGHPYARPLLGTSDTLSSFDTSHLAEFYRTYYHPETLVISVVGAIETGRAIDELAATLGEWRVEGLPHRPRVPQANTPAEIITERVPMPGKAQVDLILGVVGMARTSPDYHPAVMANIILGSLGMMGRLGSRVRDAQGVAYYVSSSVRGGPGPHPWSIIAGVHPKDVDRAVAAILDEVARLREEPVLDGELDDCRSYLTGILPLQLETNEGIATYLLSIEEYDLGLDYLQRYPAIIGSITKEGLQETVRRYFTPDRYVLTMAGTFG